MITLTPGLSKRHLEDAQTLTYEIRGCLQMRYNKISNLNPPEPDAYEINCKWNGMLPNLE